MIRNYGFIESEVEVKPEDFVFGAALPLDVVQENADWSDYLPIYEPQAEKYETAGCTVWGSQNQIEIYFKKVFGFEPNYSERYNYNIVGILPPGARPNDAYQSYRHYGLLDQKELPVTPTFQEFITPRPVTEELIVKGKKWLEAYEIQHEWVQGADMKMAVINALKFSPIGVSVTAWSKQGEFYVDNGQPNTHWCVAYGYQTNADGSLSLKVFDSYDHSTKVLHPNHRVAFAKRIFVQRVAQKPLTSWQKWQQFLTTQWCKHG